VSARVVDQAKAFAAAGRPDEALNTVAAFLASNPEDREALIVAGDALNALHRYHEAQRIAYRVLAADPADLGGLIVGVTAAIGRQDRSTAIAMADEAVRVHPDNWYAHAAVARVGIAGAKPGDRALRSAQELVTLDPSSASSHILLGEVWRLRGEFVDATSAFRTALAIDPLNANAANNLAVVMLHRRRPAAAVRVFGDILRRDPLYELARINIATCVKTLISNLALVSGGIFALMALMALSSKTTGASVAGPLWQTAAAGLCVVLVMVALFLVRAGRPVLRYLFGHGRPHPPVALAAIVALAALPTGLALAAVPADRPVGVWQAGMLVSVIVPSLLLGADTRRAKQGAPSPAG